MDRQVSNLESPHESTASKSAVRSFLDVCRKFQTLSKEGLTGSAPIWGGNLGMFKYLLRHPFRLYGTLFRGFRAQSSIGDLTPLFPLEAMTAFLSQFTESELKSLKTLSEIQLRRLKSAVTDNPVFRISVPVGAAYAALELSDKLVTVRGSELDLLKLIFQNPQMQTIIGSLLFGFIVGIVFVAASYLFVNLPAIARAQILDDLLQIALEEKRFGSTPAAHMQD